MLFGKKKTEEEMVKDFAKELVDLWNKYTGDDKVHTGTLYSATVALIGSNLEDAAKKGIVPEHVMMAELFRLNKLMFAAASVDLDDLASTVFDEDGKSLKDAAHELSGKFQDAESKRKVH